MKNRTTIARAFKAEWLKIKGLGLLTLAIIFGILIPGLIFTIEMFSEGARAYDGLLASAATRNIENTVSPFGTFFMLLLIIIAATRVTQIDHKNNGWTFLETQPVSKLNIYTAKFLVLVVLSLIMFSVYFLSSILLANLSVLLYPQEGLQVGVQVYWIFQTLVRLFILSLCIISLQLMLSVIIPGFVWPFAVGFVGFVINIVGAVRGEIYDYVPYNNVNTGLSFKNSFHLNSFFNYTEYLSLFWAVLFFIVGYFWYSRRGFRNAFLNTTKAKLSTVMGLVVFIGIYFLIVKPIHPQKLEDRTVVGGTIQSAKPIKNVTIISTEFGEKMAEIPIHNGSFRWQSKENIPFARYTINYDGKAQPFIFSKGDQIHFDIKTDSKQSEVLQKGTRKAEALYDSSTGDGSEFYNYIIATKMYADNPAAFYKEARKEWKKKVKQLHQFRTAENIYISEDFRDFQLQQSAARMLSAIYDYQKMTSFTDEKFAPQGSFVKELQSVIRNPSPLLYSSDTYMAWKLKELLPKEGSADPDSVVFVKLKQMPAGILKDQLLSSQIIKMTTLENNEMKRNLILKENIGGITNPKFTSFVSNHLQILNNQQKGKAFPTMAFEDADGKKVNLSQFKGRFVVIDFWATWCAPCKETSPIFAYQAKKNKHNNQIVFLAVSIDEDRSKWKLDLKNTQSDVKQWRLADASSLKQLGVEGIPRFMMLDPNGKIFNAKMPLPGETNFVDILQKATGPSTNFVDMRF